MNIRRLSICFAIMLVTALPAFGQNKKGPSNPKQFVVEDVVNDQSTFKIKVTADRADGTYYEGEALTFTVLAEKDCYVYLLNIRPDGEISCLFPNERQKDNRIAAGASVPIPGPGATYVLRARKPFGDEVIQVVASLNPVDLFPGKGLTTRKVTGLTYSDLRNGVNRMKGFEVEVDPTPDPGPNRDFWAEGKFSLRTVEGRRPN